MSRIPRILIALGAALLVGASTPLAKLALSFTNPLLVAGPLYLGSGIAILQANHPVTIISMRGWAACASDRRGSPPPSSCPLS